MAAGQGGEQHMTNPPMGDGSPPPDWLQAFFRPRSVVMIGASERSAWSNMVFRRFATYEYAGKLFGVNPSGTPAHGLPTFTSCTDIPEHVDMAFVMVRAALVAEALADAAAAGIRNAVVLSSGFAETGPAGAALQQALVEQCEAAGMRMLGPNSLGFANMAEHLLATSIPARLPLAIGAVGVVAQSGSIAADISRLCHQQNIGMSFLCAPGNAAMVGILDALAYMIGDPATRIILVYAETALPADRFRELAARALQARKPIIVYKVGRSAMSAAVARAHTGSVVGNDRVFDVVCQQYGILRVGSIEELVMTGGLIDASGPLDPGRGIAFISVSGGAAAMYADLAEDHGVAIPQFSQTTVAALQGVVPSFATVSNPLDITGGALTQPEIWTRAIPLVLNDPAIGFAVTLMGVPTTPDETLAQRPSYEAIAQGYRQAGKAAVIVGQVFQPISQFTQGFLAETGCHYAFCCLDMTVRALGHLTRWSQALRKGPPQPAALPPSALPGEKPHGESAVLAYLGSRGVPVVPAILATTEAQAITAAEGLAGPVVLKIASPDIEHKSEIGGVKLNLDGSAAVAGAWHAILANTRSCFPDARIEGVLVAPMRSAGLEMFVGVARDPDWGLVLAVGMGGVWIELLKDTVLRPLPVSQAEVIEMLGALRAAPLLMGYRATPPVDMARLADAIVAIANAALALDADLVSLEVNPLLVCPDRIEALDALAIYG